MLPNNNINAVGSEGRVRDVGRLRMSTKMLAGRKSLFFLQMQHFLEIDLST